MVQFRAPFGAAPVQPVVRSPLIVFHWTSLAAGVLALSVRYEAVRPDEQLVRVQRVHDERLVEVGAVVRFRPLRMYEAVEKLPPSVHRYTEAGGE